MKKILYVLPVVGLMFLSACASTEDPVNDEDKSAETLYNEAYNYLNKTSYQKAAETFDKVEMEHPYSKWATKSKLMSAYSYYKDEKYDDAIAALDRYIRLHPGNKDVAYAFISKASAIMTRLRHPKRNSRRPATRTKLFLRLSQCFRTANMLPTPKPKWH